MARTVCYISDEGFAVVCIMECLDDEQVAAVMGSTTIDCEKCPMKEEHKKFCQEVEK